MLKLFHQNYSTVCTFPCTVLILVLSVIPLPRPDEIRDVFIQFGGLMVNWPHKAQSKAYFPPNGIYQHTVTHMWLIYTIWRKVGLGLSLVRPVNHQATKLYVTASCHPTLSYTFLHHPTQSYLIQPHPTLDSFTISTLSYLIH